VRDLISYLAIDLTQIDLAYKAGKRDGGPVMSSLRRDLGTLDATCPPQSRQD
jgi:hypothetical protein